MATRLKPNARMKQEVEMLDSLFEYATEGIVVVNSKAEIVMINPKALEMFGYTKDELLHSKIEKLIPARFSRHEQLRDNYMENPHPRAMGHGIDLYARKKDNTEFPVEVSLSNFKTHDGNFVMSFLIDITERKKQEVQLKLASERLQQTSEALSRLNADLENKVNARTEELAEAIRKLAESKREVMKALEKEKELNVLKSRFVTTASHEFRTPLGTILSSASLISRYNDEGDSDKRLRHIDRIKSAVNNLTEILNDFLSLDKLEEGIIRNNPIHFNLEEFLIKLIDELKSITKNNQTINFYSSSDSNTVCLDQQLFRNVFINLVSNAIKYSPENKEIRIESQVKDETITLSIVDQGIGIPKEDQIHMFERFFRATNAGNIQGTGLGLNIVKKYIELMRGQITFTSEAGQGTTFIIKLPQYQN